MAARAQVRAAPDRGDGDRIPAAPGYFGTASMSLIVFRSKAAGEIFMFAETARRIFAILGREDAARGVITAEQVPAALQHLLAAVEQEKAELKAAAEAAQDSDRRGEDAGRPPAITLGQRAFPLIEMLRAAEKKRVDVTWGV
jgi:hypothetical protein